MLLSRVPQLSRTQYRIAALVSVLLCLALLLLSSKSWRDVGRHTWWKENAHQKSVDSAQLVEINVVEAEPPSSSSPQCVDHLRSGYLQSFTDRAVHYCEETSSASMTCLNHRIHDKIDVLCIAGPALVDAERKSVELPCQLRDWTENDEANKNPTFYQFPSYWYNTGARPIFRDFISLREDNDTEAVGNERGFTILVRREGAYHNLWHTMMEIMSMTMTLDILRDVVNPQHGRPFWTYHDVENTRVMFLDDQDDGPFYDLWSMFAHLPPVRLSDMPASSTGHTNLIIPLAGSSNPFWQGDWVDLNCGESVLLQTFSRRVLAFFKVRDSPPRSERRIVLTLIDRKEKRRLLHKVEYFDAVKAKFPQILVRIVDFAVLDFAEQIQVVQSTDILMGVHGAGLTHGMFLPSDSAVVEIQPPELHHKGFDLMAKSLGHRYYVAHGTTYDSQDKVGDWQQDDVLIDETVFIELVSEAVRDTLERT